MEENHNNTSSAQSDANNSPSTPAARSGSTSQDIRQKRTLSRTRTGCSTCKRRKIKCDERKPSCRNCLKHNVRCGYLQAGGLGGGQGGTHSTPTTPAPVPVPVPAQRPNGAFSDIPEPPLNLIDLELLHNFCMFTYSTFSQDTAVRNFWKFTVVRLGVRCDYVMRSILAVSALHMAHYQPEKRDFFVSRAIAYHQAASRTATRLIGEMRLEDRENLWIFSILTIYFALGSPRTQDASLLMGESAFPDWLFLLRGAQQLFRELQSSTYNGHLTPLVARGQTRWNASHSPQHANSPLLRDLQSRINATLTDSALLSIYNYAIDELRMQLSLCVSEGKNSLDLMDAFVWQFVLADTFVPLLANPTQEAAAIFAHFCVILKRFDEHWWLQGWGTVLIARVWEILDSVHRPWIQWVVEEMGWIPP